MDLHLQTDPKFYYQSPLLPNSQMESQLETNPGYKTQKQGNPFDQEPTFNDPICKFNLKETSEFLHSFPPMAASNKGGSNGGGGGGLVEKRKVGGRRLSEPPPSTPGRPVFSFCTVSNFARKTFPSKWDNAEKWLISSSSCHDSPVHSFKPTTTTTDSSGTKHVALRESSSDDDDDKVPRFDNLASMNLNLESDRRYDSFSGTNKAINGCLITADVLLKDKFTNNVEQRYSEFGHSNHPNKEGFVFNNSSSEYMKGSSIEVVHQAQHRDIGITGMSPLRGSSKTSISHTPIKFPSPPRHNTPQDRSGVLTVVDTKDANASIDIAQFHECHLAKLNLGSQYGSLTSNWSSKEEEEEEVSKSLRHFEEGEGRKLTEAVFVGKWDWEEDEKIKHCLRYQREEAKIQAWMNLESAKAEAQSRKLEVKIQKMRSNLEEKLLKKMAIVHRKAEEWRAEAQQEHTKQIGKDILQAEKKKMMNKHQHNYNSYYASTYSHCTCFPCSNNRSGHNDSVTSRGA